MIKSNIDFILAARPSVFSTAHVLKSPGLLLLLTPDIVIYVTLPTLGIDYFLGRPHVT